MTSDKFFNITVLILQKHLFLQAVLTTIRKYDILSTQCAERIRGMSFMKEAMICDEMSERIIEATERLATEYGAHAINVRMVLKKLEITNRVFYNRFHNINEVLETVYERTIMQIRESMRAPLTPEQDFFEYVLDVVVRSLLLSYDNKMRFYQYVLENESISHDNYVWWTGEIKKLIEYAKAQKLIKDVDSDVLSYSIWCFCRGYNADVVGRKVPKEIAVEHFKYSFRFLLDGLRA